MTNTELSLAIVQFKESISWADELAPVFLPDIKMWVECHSMATFFFCHPLEVGATAKNISGVPLRQGSSAVIVIAGDCPEFEQDRLTHELIMLGISPWWLGIKQSVRHSRWLMQVSDGHSFFDLLG